MEEQRKSIELPNGETYSYQQLGDPKKPILVMLHGTFMSSVCFTHFFDHLYKKFHIIAPDLRGCGESSYEAPIKKIEDFVFDLAHFAHILGLKKFRLVGHSLGAAVAQLYALKYPDQVEHLTLINTVGVNGLRLFDVTLPTTLEEVKSNKGVRGLKMMFESGDAVNIKKYFALSFSKDPGDEVLGPIIEEAELCRNAIGVVYALATFDVMQNPNTSTHISKLKCPVLMIHGAKDVVCSVMEAKNIVKLLTSQRAQLKPIEDAGHFYSIKQTEVVCEYIYQSQFETYEDSNGNGNGHSK